MPNAGPMEPNLRERVETIFHTSRDRVPGPHLELALGQRIRETGSHARPPLDRRTVPEPVGARECNGQPELQDLSALITTTLGIGLLGRRWPAQLAVSSAESSSLGATGRPNDQLARSAHAAAR